MALAVIVLQEKKIKKLKISFLKTEK